MRTVRQTGAPFLLAPSPPLLARGRPVDLFTFVAWVAVLIAAVTVIWPLNVPLLALAVKVRRGAEPTGYEPSELWWRCALGSLGLAVLTLILLGLTYGVVVEAEFA